MEGEFWSLRQDKVAGEGADLNYRRWGEGPPLVFLHGYPQTHVTWHCVAAEFARNFTCFFFDLRGYGASKHPVVRRTSCRLFQAQHGKGYRGRDGPAGLSALCSPGA